MRGKSIVTGIIVAIVVMMLITFATPSKLTDEELLHMAGRSIAPPLIFENLPAVNTVSSGIGAISTNLIDINDVRKPSNITEEQLRIILEKNNRPNMSKEAASYVEMEKKYGVNALFVAGIHVIESTDYLGKYAKERFNPGGLGAYDSNPDNAFRFNSFKEAIMYTGDLFVNSGPYFKEGRYSAEAIGQKYCSSPVWATNIKRQTDHWVKMYEKEFGVTTTDTNTEQ